MATLACIPCRVTVPQVWEAGSRVASPWAPSIGQANASHCRLSGRARLQVMPSSVVMPLGTWLAMFGRAWTLSQPESWDLAQRKDKRLVPFLGPPQHSITPRGRLSRQFCANPSLGSRQCSLWCSLGAARLGAWPPLQTIRLPGQLGGWPPPPRLTPPSPPWRTTARVWERHCQVSDQRSKYLPGGQRANGGGHTNGARRARRKKADRLLDILVFLSR